jgi:hypothetical protein
MLVVHDLSVFKNKEDRDKTVTFSYFKDRKIYKANEF